MKKYINILLIGLFSGMTACGPHFLDETVRSNYSPETLTDQLGFESSLIGLYNKYSFWWTRSDRQGWLAVWQDGTDITWPTQPQGEETPFYQYNLLNSTNSAAYWVWTWAYNIIENANSIIENVNNPDLVSADLTAEQKLAIEAEARFFRAYMYDHLATLYGDVPLVTERITTPKLDFVRAPIADVNKQIEEDLLFAVANLPDVDKTVEEARVNNMVASQLLAKVYLRMNEPAKSEEQSLRVINSGKYQLVNARYGVKADQPGDPFADMFIMGNQRRSQGNTEGIWVLEQENPNTVRGGSTDNPQTRRVWQAAYHNVVGMIPCDSLGGRGLARVRLNNWVIHDLYDAGDMRNSKYNIKKDFWYNDPDHPELYGKKVPLNTSDTLYYVCPYTMKWAQFDPHDIFGYGDWKDFIIMRLGETYLLLAEARFMQGNNSGAADAINALRTRANAPQVTASQINLDFILDERVRELVAEENRRMELMRTGTLIERANKHNAPGTAPTPVMEIQGLSKTNLLFPIPNGEIQLNTGANLTQNPGY